MQEVFKWVDQYGNTIFSQLRRIGSSLDWSRQVQPRHPDVQKAFQHAGGTSHKLLLIQSCCSHKLCQGHDHCR